MIKLCRITRARVLLKRAVTSLAAIFLVTAPATVFGATASSVSQWGITWNFDRAYEVGQYANGDYWVVGPVSIVSISPKSAAVGGRVINGTQINLTDAAYGFDSAPTDYKGYRDELNVAPSYTGRTLRVETGSVVSSISLDNPKSPARPALKTLAILTVVAVAPEAGAFRPDPYGIDKTSYWRERDLDYSILRSLAPVASTPNLPEVTESVRRFWNEQNTNWTAQVVHAADNQPIYGRDVATTVGNALLSLHLNYSNTQKRNLFVYLVQQGLDIYGRTRTGGQWEVDGGHQHGRKMPMVLAGIALNSSKILDVARNTTVYYFQEDRSTFYVTKADVDRVPYAGDGRQREPYTSAMIGTPEWGNLKQLDRNGSNWGISYRWVGSQYMAHALMAHLTSGGVGAWNRQAFFDYCDRYERLGSPDPKLPNGIQPFVQQMWTAYRSLSGSLVSEQGKAPALERKPLPPVFIGIN